MNILTVLNSSALYLICGFIIAFVALVCVIFIIRAYRAGLAMGIDRSKMKTVITSSATFTVLPSIGILLGVIALSGSLGLPWPWLRLSVIGALHYETQVAQAAAEQTGLSGLVASEMTMKAFTTIALLMSICIMWLMIFPLFFCKSYLNRIGLEDGQIKEKKKSSGFSDIAMTSMFIGLVSAYIGSYAGGFISGDGLFSFSGDFIPLIVVFVSGISMALFIFIAEKKHASWLDNFSVAVSMLIGMTSAVVAKLFV